MWRRCSLGFSGAAADQELVGGAPDESTGDAEQHGDDAAAWIPPGVSTLAMRPNTIQLSIPILASRAAGVDLSLMCTSLRMCLIPYPETGLERVMNLGQNRIGMSILRLARSPTVPRFPHSQAVTDRVHNSP